MERILERRAKSISHCTLAIPIAGRAHIPHDFVHSDVDGDVVMWDELLRLQQPLGDDLHMTPHGSADITQHETKDHNTVWARGQKLTLRTVAWV